MKSWLAVLLGVAVSGCGACNDPCPAEGPHDVSTRTTFGLVRVGAPLELRAACDQRSRLLGGGYWTDNMGASVFGETSADGSSHGNVPIVLASFPSDDASTWIARFMFRGDGNPDGSQEMLVAVYAYCVDPRLQLGIQVGQQRESASDPNGALASVRAPPGAVVTGGGFRMEYAQGDPTQPEPPDWQNGYVNASAPIVEDGAVVGWEAHRMPSFYGNPTAIFAYVVYATRDLEAGDPVEAAASSTQYGWGPYWGDLQCRDDEFTTGGGYRFQNRGPLSSLIAHALIENRATHSLTQWRLYGYDGYQTEPYGEPTTAAIALSAVCVKSPHPKLCVKITSPDQDHSVVALGSDDPAASSESIHFAAEAYRGGTALPGSSIEWFVDGQPFATGDAFDMGVPLPSVGHDTVYSQLFRVRALVQDAGRSASDAVSIQVVNEPPPPPVD